MPESNPDFCPEGTVVQPRPERAPEAVSTAGPDPATNQSRGDATQCQGDGDIVRARDRSMLASVPKTDPELQVDALSWSSLTVDQGTEDVSCSQMLSRGMLRVPGYRLLRQLGRGTYGLVWLGEEETTGIRVAIKFFSHGTSQQWLLLQAEVKQLAILDSDPGIVQLKDVEPEAEPPYYVMNYMEGGSLAERLEKGPIPVAEALEIFRGVAEAMAYVHAKGIRHCDLKPGNILLDSRGKPRVADFGQAHLSDDASPALGTFFYMAPEQADLCRQIPDTRWDVYGLGSLFYAMLTGRPPREDSTLRTELSGTADLSHRLNRYRDAVLRMPRPRAHWKVPGVDRPLAEIIDHCLEVDPQRRLRDAGAVLRALERRERQRRQRPLLFFGLLAPLLLLGVLGGVASYQAHHTLKEFREGQEKESLQSSKAQARLIASMVKDSLENRVNMVARAAHSGGPRDAILDALKGRQVGPDAVPACTFPTRQQLRTKLEYLGRNQFASWTLFDRDGTVLAGDQFDGGHREMSELYGQNFSWREYFNGKKTCYGRAGGPREEWQPCWWLRPGPRPVAYVSGPYQSRTRERSLCIGVTTPVFDNRDVPGLAAASVGLPALPPGPLALAGVLAGEPGEDDRFVGLFLGNIDLKGLYHWLEPTLLEDGSVLLLDNNARCLFHSRCDLNSLAIRDGADPPSYADDPAVARFLRAAGDAKDPSFLDPILKDGRTMLAWSTPVSGVSWVGQPQPDFRWNVVVQYEKKVVMQPAEDVTRDVLSWGVWLSGTAALLLLALWGWLLWILRRGERVAHA